MSELAFKSISVCILFLVCMATVIDIILIRRLSENQDMMILLHEKTVDKISYLYSNVVWKPTP
jgi:hypothetical protein